LLHHVIEVAAEVSDFVVAEAEGNGGIEIPLTDQGHFFLKFDHGALDEVGEDGDDDSANGDRSGSSEEEQGVTVRTAQGEGGNGEENQAGEEDAHDGQDCLDLPVDADLGHFWDSPWALSGRSEQLNSTSFSRGFERERSRTERGYAQEWR